MHEKQAIFPVPQGISSLAFIQRCMERISEKNTKVRVHSGKPTHVSEDRLPSFSFIFFLRECGVVSNEESFHQEPNYVGLPMLKPEA